MPPHSVSRGTCNPGGAPPASGEPLRAPAPYNAGPGRASRWRDERALEGAIYAETIPFGETRDYVKKAFTNAWFYRHRLTAKGISLPEILATIPPPSPHPLCTPIATHIPLPP